VFLLCGLILVGAGGLPNKNLPGMLQVDPLGLPVKDFLNFSLIPRLLQL
jgi:hypothetical protein